MKKKKDFNQVQQSKKEKKTKKKKTRQGLYIRYPGGWLSPAFARGHCHTKALSRALIPGEAILMHDSTLELISNIQKVNDGSIEIKNK